EADPSLTRRFGGTGLGRALCRHLVQLMRGSLDFAGCAGEGATFRFDLALPAAAPRDVPRDAAGGPYGNRITADRGPSQPAPMSSENACILLVDDGEINRIVGRGLLESLGYEVVTVSSGWDALE